MLLRTKRHSRERAVGYIEGPATEDPLSLCLANESRERLMAAVDNLPEKQGIILGLYYHEELNAREISEVMGVSQSRVSQMLPSAVTSLRNFFCNERERKEDVTMPYDHYDSVIDCQLRQEQRGVLLRPESATEAPQISTQLKPSHSRPIRQVGRPQFHG